MEPQPIQPGDEIYCPHCRRWHPLIQRHTTGTAYTIAMLYFECRRGLFYAGQLGTPARHPTRRPPTAA